MPRLLMFATPAALPTSVYTPDHSAGVGGRNMRKDAGRQEPVAIIRDARVDPATRTMMGARRGHVLAIGRLNMLYRARFGENAHGRLFADPLSRRNSTMSSSYVERPL